MYSTKSCIGLAAYIVGQMCRLVLPVVLDVPPLDLQRAGGRTRPTEGARHLHILTAVCYDVLWDFCEDRWKTKEETSHYVERPLVNLKIQQTKSQKCCFSLIFTEVYVHAE